MKLRMPLTERLRRRRDEKPGQAVIEMAFVMIILLILSFGMVDFGMLLTGYIRASNCAREAARTAVVREPGADGVCAAHQLTPLFESATVSLDPAAYEDLDSGTEVKATVVATYRWKAIAPLMNAFFPGSPWDPTITTTTTTTMRMEGRRP
jgi:Flp pilus assembly protein TadG